MGVAIMGDQLPAVKGRPQRRWHWHCDVGPGKVMLLA